MLEKLRPDRAFAGLALDSAELMVRSPEWIDVACPDDLDRAAEPHWAIGWKTYRDGRKYGNWMIIYEDVTRDEAQRLIRAMQAQVNRLPA